jgi:hypothetical protein
MKKQVLALLLAGAVGIAHAASALAPATQAPSAAPAASDAGFGYPTVAAALAALHADPGVLWKEQDGWTLALDKAHQTIWSFTPPGQPAYPAAIKRVFVKRETGTAIEMKVLCQAPRPACDAMVRKFAERTQAAIVHQRERAASAAAAASAASGTP